MASTDELDKAGAAQELLRDAFTRLIEHVDELTDGLTDEVSFRQPTPAANSIAWLIWHSARIQDHQLADVAGVAVRPIDAAHAAREIVVAWRPGSNRGPEGQLLAEVFTAA